MDLEFSWGDKTVVSPVYLRSDKERGEPLLLGTNLTIPLRLMEPAAGVEARAWNKGADNVGTVRLLKAERIPGGHGAIVCAKLEGVVVGSEDVVGGN